MPLVTCWVDRVPRLEVPMMTGRLRVPLGYSPDMEARVLELPLITRRISIFLLLPDDMERGLALLEANLTMDNLRTLLATLKVPPTRGIYRLRFLGRLLEM